MLLFSYGSNHPKQLAERLGHPIVGRGAYIEGWQRVFRGWSDRWDGGVASLEKKGGTTAVTYGYVADVSPADLDRLDRFEGVGNGKYKRMGVTVRVPEDYATHTLPAVVYVSTSRTFNAPSPLYLKAVAKTVGTFWRGAKPEDFPIR